MLCYKTCAIIETTPRTKQPVELSLKTAENQAVHGAQPSQVESQLPGSNTADDENGMILKVNCSSVGIL